MKKTVYLNALRAFEATARHKSFSGAADELSVTPAAIGQLVRGLEEWLGSPLFYRSSKGQTRLTLTETATRALPILQDGFEKISLGLATLKDSASGGIITVTVSPSFAAKWLLPRIERFHSTCPETNIRLETSLKLTDFKTNNIDIGVRYGKGEWPGLVAEKLMDEEIFPVCSAALLRENPRLNEHPLQLLNHTLIHDVSISENSGFATWRAWFTKIGVEMPTQNGLQINNSAAVLQTAIDKNGVALARSVLVQDDIASGRLLRLYPQVRYQSELSYYVVFRPDWENLPRLVKFKKWLFSETFNEF